MQKSFKLGDIVYIRYVDHVLFKDSDPILHHPLSRESIGWLDYEDDECIRLVWERFAVPDMPHESKIRATGITILKKAILKVISIG